MFDNFEHVVLSSVHWPRLVMEAMGALVILAGLLATVRRLVPGSVAGHPNAFANARVTFAKYLTLALELQLAADVLSTSVSPSWDQIGKLAAIAVIRTALNHFLRQEMHEVAVRQQAQVDGLHAMA